MAKINDTTTFPNTAPALGDHVIGTDVSNVTNDAAGETVSFTWQSVMDLMEANMTVPGSVSAAYRTSTILSSTSNAEGAALIGVEDAGTYFAGANVEAVLAEIGALLPAEANADVTDETNVLAALSGATLTEVDPAATDKILVLDASDTFNIKNVTWSDVTAAAAAATPEGTAILSGGPVTDGYVLTADGAGGAAWEASAGGASAINDLTDVTITSAAQGDILYHNGTAWVDLSPGTSGQFLQTQGAAANPQWATPAGSGNVSNSGTPADNQLAVWTDSTTIEGIATLTYDATDFEISADLIPNADGTIDLGSPANRFASLSVDSIDLNGTTLDGTTLADPGADRIMFWDDSAGSAAYLAASTGLTISDTSMTVDTSTIASLATLAATTNGNGASLIGIEDAGTLITATTVEGALAENRGLINSAAQKAGAVYTGVHDFGGATLEIPNGATPTVDAAGEIAIDTTVTDWSHGILEYFSGEAMAVVAMPVAQLTTPTNGAVPTYNATNDEFELAVPAGSGDVSKVGTPVDGQIGVWTGDGTIEGDASLTFDTTDDTLVIAASGKLGFGAVDILSDSAGTTTLQNIDALDATTEATIEAAIDTLANLTSVQGHTVTLTGDFIRSGAHSLTLTTGGATNVTLPTTGTLAAYGDTTANFTGTLQNGGSNVVVDTDIGSTVQAFDADTLKADTADQLTAGFTAATDDDSTAASPYTPDHDTGNYKRVINDGAMTINGPTMASGESTSIVILLTNTTGAGAITFGTTTDSGDTIGTTTTDEYLIFITAVDVGGTTYSHASVKALQ